MTTTNTVDLTDLPEDNPLVLAAHAVYERNATHGTPEDSFEKIAALWGAYLGIDLDPFEVGDLMNLLKIARSKTAQTFHRDNYADMCGYATLTADMAKEHHERRLVATDGGEPIDPAYEQAYRELVGDN